LAVIMTAALGTLAPTIAKAATPATGTVITDFGGHLQKHVVGAALAAQINSGNWKGLTIAQLASAGIFPGMSHGATDAPMATVKAPASMAAVTAGSVANPLGIDTCTYAGYWFNNALLGTSNEVCGDGAFWAYDSGTITWPNQTNLCNTWVNFSGQPCLVVHK
jgi:hypothetical protein